jgi:hypothetical protein
MTASYNFNYCVGSLYAILICMKPDIIEKIGNDCRVSHISDQDYYLCRSISTFRYECPYIKTYAFCDHPDRHKLPEEKLSPLQKTTHRATKNNPDKEV